MKIELTIPGTRIAKARPRFARAGKYVKTYNPQESEEGKWLTLAMKKMPKKPLQGPLHICLAFGMPIPASTSKKRRAAMLAYEERHTKKPDLDNLVKFALDCLNGIAWSDDSQIMSILAAKNYAENPATVIGINEVEHAYEDPERIPPKLTGKKLDEFIEKVRRA